MLTYEDFTDLYGSDVSEAEFDLLEPQACALIDSITNYAITMGEDNAPSSFAWGLLGKAVAAQIVYFVEGGGLAAVTSGNTGEGFTVGKVHLEKGTQTNSAALYGNGISPAVYALLGPTGLLGRSVPCFDRFRTLY